LQFSFYLEFGNPFNPMPTTGSSTLDNSTNVAGLETTPGKNLIF